MHLQKFFNDQFFDYVATQQTSTLTKSQQRGPKQHTDKHLEDIMKGGCRKLQKKSKKYFELIQWMGLAQFGSITNYWKNSACTKVIYKEVTGKKIKMSFEKRFALTCLALKKHWNDQDKAPFTS